MGRSTPVHLNHKRLLMPPAPWRHQASGRRWQGTPRRACARCPSSSIPTTQNLELTTQNWRPDGSLSFHYFLEIRCPSAYHKCGGLLMFVFSERSSAVP